MLAYWLATEKDALLCDLAETYRIYDYRSIPVRMLATFVAGLDEDSRVGRIRDGRKVSIETYYLAELCDMLEALLLGLSGKNGSPNRCEALLIKKAEDKPGTYTVDEYNRLRERIMKKG